MSSKGDLIAPCGFAMPHIDFVEAANRCDQPLSWSNLVLQQLRMTNYWR